MEKCTTETGIGDTHYEFIETVRDCYLYQYTLELTRGRSSNTPSCIDLILIFSNEEDIISDINLDSSLVKSDHSVIMFTTFNSYVSGSGDPKTRYKYEKGDYVNMSEFLKIDWDEFLGQKDIDSQWSSYSEKLSEAREI